LDTSDLHGNYGAKVVINNTGTKIKNVTVQCVSNKVIFEDKTTLVLNRYALINEYAVPDVATGESFTADCNFGWSLWMNDIEGLFILGGGGIAGVPELGIGFRLNNGNPSLIYTGGAPKSVTADFAGYSYSQVTAIDGSYIIHYNLPLSWFRQQKIIHMIARRHDEGLKWRVAPVSEPTIADIVQGNGFRVTATGNQEDWGIVLKRVVPP